jgi:hypothetical protein
MADWLPRPSSGGPTAPATASGPGSQAARGELVGAVLGPITVATRHQRSLGYPVLVATTLLMSMVLVTGAAIRAIPVAVALWGLPVPILLLAAMTGVSRAVRAVWPPPTADRAGWFGLPLIEHSVRLFRVQTVSGETFTCALRGEPAGAELRAGDLVRLRSRRPRQGQYLTRRIELLFTPTGPVAGQLTARVPFGVLLRGWIDRLCLILAALAVAWVGYRIMIGR